MKKVMLLLLILVVSCLVVQKSYAVNSNLKAKLYVAEASNTLQLQGAGLTVEQFLDLSPKEIHEATGKKLNVKETIALKAAQKKIKKELKQSQDGKPKSQLVALLLGILVGALGIHRFYLGYTTIGIIQLLTLGGCGVWALIDVIRIAMGDLLPADGSAYDPAL